MTMLALDPFKSLIRERCGLVFEGVAERRLATALGERMRALGASHGVEYLATLEASDAEFRALVNLLTINETYFFREPEQIQWLVERVVPRLLSRRGPEARVRILSAGCSSGEEPYSLAIALYQRYGATAAQLFEIVAGDIDGNVLARAQEAVYSSFSFRAMSASLRDAYFEAIDGRFRLNAAIRGLVGFRELNLVALPSVGDGARYDLVLMRNVSIYFDAPTRRGIQERLRALMSEDAVLLTGSAETLANDLGVLHLAEEDGHFHFVNSPPSRQASARPPTRQAPPWEVSSPVFRAGVAQGRLSSSATAAPTPPMPTAQPLQPAPVPVSEAAPKPAADPAPDLATIRQLLCEERYEPALPLLAQWLEAAPDDVAAQLLYAFAHLNRRQFELVGNLAQRVIGSDPWSVDAHFLLGMSAKWQDDLPAAVDWFKKAAYLCRTCWPAHYYLGGLYSALGDERAAMRAWRGCLQLLDTPELDSGIRHLPLGLREPEIRFLCERRVKVSAAVPSAGNMGRARWR